MYSRIDTIFDDIYNNIVRIKWIVKYLLNNFCIVLKYEKRLYGHLYISYRQIGNTKYIVHRVHCEWWSQNTSLHVLRRNLSAINARSLRLSTGSCVICVIYRYIYNASMNATTPSKACRDLICSCVLSKLASVSVWSVDTERVRFHKSTIHTHT